MPNINSYPETTTDLQRLLAALQKALADAQAAKARQDFHKSERQVASQDLKATLTQGRDLAMRLRSAAKFKIGPRNEKLAQFNIKPLRKRTRKATAPAAPAATPPPAAAPAAKPAKP